MPTYTGTPATDPSVTPYYPTRTYKELLYAVSRLSGIEPSTLLNDDALAFRDSASVHLRDTWEYYLWPHLIATTRDTKANLNNHREKEIFGFYETSPLVDRYAVEYTWTLDASGYTIIDDNLASTSTVWFQYRLPVYPFDGIDWSNATTYAEDEMAYDSATGDYYRSIAGGNYQNGISDTSYWDRRSIPSFLFEYVKYNTVADLRESTGQGQKTPVLRAQGERRQMMEIDKFERQRNLQKRPRVKVRSGG